MKKRWILFLVVCSLLTTGIISIRMKSTNISDVQTEEQQKNRNQTAKEAGPQKSAIELEFKDFDRLEPEFAKGQVDNLQQLMTLYLEEYEEKVLAGTVTYHPEKQNIRTSRIYCCISPFPVTLEGGSLRYIMTCCRMFFPLRRIKSLWKKGRKL